MTSQVARIILTGTPFMWLGAVVAISFIEAPLKFRAPGITIPLGLGIGRLVFRALNIAEAVLAVLLTGAFLVYPHRPGFPEVALLVAAWAILAVQVAVLRPPLDHRTQRWLAGDVPAASRLHLAYIALEVAKVGVLAALGCLLVIASTRT